MKNPFGQALAAAALALALAAPAGAASITRFLEPGAVSTAFWDVNNAGTIVGYSSFDVGGPDTQSRAFIFQGGVYTPLAGLPGAANTFASGISDAGVVVGSSRDAAGNGTGYIFQGGAYTAFVVPGATSTELRAISPNGRYISGYFSSPTDLARGFVYDTLTTTLTYVSAGGNDFTIAQGVDDNGHVVGSDRIFDDTTGALISAPGFVFDLATGTRTDYTTPGYGRTNFRAIDDDGVVSGWLIGPEVVGFTGGPLDRHLIHVDFQTFVEGNNNAGTLVGQFSRDDGSFGAFIAQVPAPASVLLVLAGLAALRSSRRRN